MKIDYVSHLKRVKKHHTSLFKRIQRNENELLNREWISDISRAALLSTKRAVIEIKELYKKYGLKKNYALKNINMKVYEGDIHGLIGRNGAGKTTLMKILVGALHITKGDAWIYSKKVKNVNVKKYLGYVPEKAAFENNKNETVWKYLWKIGILNGLRGKKLVAKINEVVETMGIKDLLKLSPYGFSSGQKKKVLISQALLSSPKLLILDEPTASLDPIARVTILEKLKDLVESQKITILISSHILAELQKYVTGWTILDNGEILLSRSLNINRKDEGGYRLVTTDNKRAEIHFGGFNIINDYDNNQLFIHIESKQESIEFQKKLFQLPVEILHFEKENVNLQYLFNKFTKNKHNQKRKIGKNIEI